MGRREIIATPRVRRSIAVDAAALEVASLQLEIRALVEEARAVGFDAMSSVAGEQFQRWSALNRQAVLCGIRVIERLTAACEQAALDLPQSLRAGRPYSRWHGGSTMQTPRIFVAYGPRGGGLRCALAYVPAGNAVRGWYIGRTGSGLESAYFELENYHSRGPFTLRTVREGDLHTGWIDDDAAHELASLREAFVNEWLFYRDEVGAELQLAAYGARGLPGGDVGVRADRLARLDTGGANWTYYSPAFEHGVLEILSKRWSLEFTPVPA